MTTRPTLTDALDNAARTVGCFNDFADLERKCREGYCPTLMTELRPTNGKHSAETMRFVNAARDVAHALEQRGLRYFPRAYSA